MHSSVSEDVDDDLHAIRPDVRPRIERPLVDADVDVGALAQRSLGVPADRPRQEY